MEKKKTCTDETDKKKGKKKNEREIKKRDERKGIQRAKIERIYNENGDKREYANPRKGET